MEALIVVAILLIFWTNESLFGKEVFQEKKKKSKEAEFAEALKKYLEAGIDVNTTEKK